MGDCGGGESQEANLPTFPILPRAQAPSLLNNSNLNICIWGQFHVKMQISQDNGANVKMSFEIESKQFLAGEAYPKICCKSASDIWQN